MANTNTPNAESVLSTLSEETRSSLETHFRQQIASELTGGVSEPRKRPGRPAGSKAAKSGRGRGKRLMTNDGTERSASQFIRDCKDSMSAKEVVEAAKEVGLNIAPALVYNVRKNAEKKAAEAKPAKAPKAKADKADKKESKASPKQLAALKKAWAARKANAKAKKAAAK